MLKKKKKHTRALKEKRLPLSPREELQKKLKVRVFKAELSWIG